jgi:hypothetical protein
MSGRRLAEIAAVALCVGLHATLAFEVLGQPLDAGASPPSERAPTWWLSNDSVHRPGPGADLFGVYHAALALERGESIYTRVESPPTTPYFFPFRYLPVVAQTIGSLLARLSPHAAYLAWGLVLEAFVLIALVLIVRSARSSAERVAGVSLLCLSSPFFLELHMGQFTFVAALLAMIAALAGERLLAAEATPRWRVAATRLWKAALAAAAAALKLFPIAALAVWLKRGRWGVCAAVVAAVVLLNAPYFSSSPGELSAFAAANFQAPQGGLDTGNFSPLYVAYLVARAAGLAPDEAGFLEGAAVFHLGVLAITVVAVFLSRETRLWAGVATVMLAHFVGYVHVWEHHSSAILVIGLIVWLKRRELAVPPGRVWGAAVVACLAVLALPTPFALLETDFDGAQWSAAGGLSTAAGLLLASSKALPLTLLWALLLHAHVRAGLAWPWKRCALLDRWTKLPRAAKIGGAGACAALAAMILFFCVGADGVWTGFPLDDAWIHRVYARAFAGGHGFQYNVGVDEAGATSPLWIVVSAPAEWLAAVSTDAVAIAVKVISAALAALFAAGVVAVARTAFEDRPVIAALPAVVVAADPRLVFSLLSGMENALVAALWIWAIAAALRKRWALLACLAALLPLARPEAALILPAIWIPIATARGTSARRRAILLAATLVPAAMWAAFCWRATGHLLPNAFYVKAGAVADVAAIARNTVAAVTASGYASTAAFPIGLAGFAAWWWAQGRRAGLAGLLLVALPLAYALAVSASRDVRLDGYYWTRWYDPPALLLTAASALGGVWLARRSWEHLRRRRAIPRSKVVVSAIALIAVAAGAALSVVQIARSARSSRDLLASNIAVIDRMNVAAGRWIERHAEADQVVGTQDAGAVKYFGKRPTIDLGGLNYHELAFDWSLSLRALRRSSWLVAFPEKLAGTVALERFEKAASFGVEYADYSICDCPSQTEMAVFRRIGVVGRR